MVAISFCIFKEKVRTGEKRRTTRPFSGRRYRQLQHIGRVQLYWKQRTKECEKLGEGEILELAIVKVRKWGLLMRWDPLSRIYQIVEKHKLGKFVKEEGFDSYEDYYQWLEDRYGSKNLEDMEFMTIKWYLTGERHEERQN